MSELVFDTTISWNFDTLLNIAFLILIARLGGRFLRTGGLVMLREMELPPDRQCGPEPQASARRMLRCTPVTAAGTGRVFLQGGLERSPCVSPRPVTSASPPGPSIARWSAPPTHCNPTDGGASWLFQTEQGSRGQAVNPMGLRRVCPVRHPKGMSSATRLGPVLTGAVVLTLLAATAGQAAGLPVGGLNPAHRMYPASGLGRPMPQAAVQDPLTGQFNCQKPHNPNGNYHCYGPAQIRAAYAIEPLLDSGLNGVGVTIVIIDAFQNPTMASDLARFDSTFGLPAPPSFRTLAPYGLTPFDPTNSDQVGWSGEIALDVEWAHAIAPRAGIVLTLSPSDNDPDIVATERYVVQHAVGNVVSMSYGEAEQCMDSGLQQQQHALFEAGTSKGITFVAGSGDEGAAQFNSAVTGGPPCVGGGAYIKAVSTPASDPFVTSVGGTDLHADLKTGKYQHESVWNEGVSGGASGGGFSSLYSRPSYQSGIHHAGSMRGVPDVALTASFAHGVIVTWGSSGSSGEFWVFFGTSVATPQWAALIAIADQEAGHGLGNVNAALYGVPPWPDSHSDFHDITDGNNNFGSIKGYASGPGWDAATGLGSPIADLLVPAVAGAVTPG
jgi:hypothetical protein